MIAYVDSSSLVKAYVQEEGTDRVLGLMGSDAVIAVSRIGFAEVVVALHRKGRRGDLAPEELGRAVADFRQDWEEFSIVELDARVTERVDRLAAQHDLRAFDLIHLAAAVLVAEGAADDVQFWSADRRLAGAAALAGLAVRA